MKLHELVQMRNLLDESIALEELRTATDTLLQRIDSVTRAEEFAMPLKNVRSYYATILNILDTQPKEFTVMRNQIAAQIEDITKDWHARGYIINGFYGSGTSDVQGERNDRILPLSSEVKKIIEGRLALYSSWQYPGLEIGPGDGDWTPSLVANDPLYIADTQQEFLDSTAALFNEDYRRRMRKYQIDHVGNDILSLPHNQIGFALAWNVFNYFPEEELRNYLSQVFKLLRPGGVLLFSYNNCDNPSQAGFAEDGWMSWMPKTLLAQILNDIGYETLHYFDPEVNVSWVEVKKPGIKTTVKAHQVLGEIKTRNS